MTSLALFLNDSAPENSDDPMQKSVVDLWAKIEKKQRRNQKFIVDKALLFTDFQTKILPLEVQHGEQLAELVKFLIPFIGRKSLSDYQREELLCWIESKIDYLRFHPFVGDVGQNALDEALRAAIDDFMGSQNVEVQKHEIAKLRHELEQLFDDELPLSDEVLTDFLKDPSLLDKYLAQTYAKVNGDQEFKDDEEARHPFDDECDDERDDDNWFDDFFSQHEQEQSQSHKKQETKHKGLDKLFKAGQLNKIYKRLAAVLHPDKEQDPLKKEEKHTIMQQLLEARQNKDAYTLLQLYQTHINDGEFKFDENTLNSVQALLREKLHALDDDLQLEKMNGDMSSLVWRVFYNRNKKVTSKNFEEHIIKLEDEYYELHELMQENKTVTKMKRLLQERVEYNRDCGFSLPMDFREIF